METYKSCLEFYRPKYGDQYYYISWVIDSTTPCVCEAVWHGEAQDYMRWKSGNFFYSKSRADDYRFKIYEELTGKEWGGVKLMTDSLLSILGKCIGLFLRYLFIGAGILAAVYLYHRFMG